MSTLTAASVVYIVVHCSNTKPRQKVDKAYMERVHRMKGRLWIGYHYVIDRKGNIETGRELHQAGAHAPGFDSKSIGICMAGGLDQEGNRADNFTKDQRENLLQLIAMLHQKFPQAIVVGHRDLPNAKTECPNFDVKQFLQEAGYVQPIHGAN
ncbi:N-acetylmuramoyl-L-alanine amidase [Burkholderia cepacia]|uniref:N-acetylmuramoyl-L-alanine amidase n=1 Tax=Burkholderia cepacia TaxID=292 RepID=UPI001CF42248|nr:N-acetylmuramoyl-L-alanine amidase [Burkholderia cepacia]MCA8110275.1 N-acetylmuramoyl-L-alanine amidase [Burkholderia cepacia]MCA8396574.1 N-acetylmuramoyl-L-alanine amidase [Burkholderia cepacia]